MGFGEVLVGARGLYRSGFELLRRIASTAEGCSGQRGNYLCWFVVCGGVSWVMPSFCFIGGPSASRPINLFSRRRSLPNGVMSSRFLAGELWGSAAVKGRTEVSFEMREALAFSCRTCHRGGRRITGKGVCMDKYVQVLRRHDGMGGCDSVRGSGRRRG
jgi:hypothetical protein